MWAGSESVSTSANSSLLCEELDMPHNSVLLLSYQHWSQASELIILQISSVDMYTKEQDNLQWN